MKLPHLNALRAFEAAGRQGSFLLAAEELHVSSASISRFIKILEADLNVQLFKRKASGVELTDIGRKYLLEISIHLQSISSISESYRTKNDKQTLQIFSIPAIAETWLVSQLWTFQQKYKNIEINLVLDDREPCFSSHDNSIWLRYAEDNFPNAQTFALPKDQLSLICSPKIAHSLKQPSDIYKHKLLIDVDWRTDWKAWLKAASLPDLSTESVVEFERYSMVINAAIAGSGVAIGHTALLKTYFDMGTLVKPFSIETDMNKQFLAIIDKHPPSYGVKQFINWFLGNRYFA